MSNDALTRWVPWMILGTATLHVAVGFVLENPFGEMVGDRLVGSVGEDPERSSALWYMTAGLFLFALGGLARWTVRETGRLPARLGVWILVGSVPVIVLMPASGAYLNAAVGVIAILAARGAARGKGSRADADDVPVRTVTRT